MKRFKSCFIALMTLLLLVLPGLLAAQMNESGSFYNFLFGDEPNCVYDNWITHVSERVANPGFNYYAPWDRQTEGFGSFTLPDTMQSVYWQEISLAFCAQRWESVYNLVQSVQQNYDFVHFQDIDQNRDYYILREKLNRAYDDNGTETREDDETGSFDLGWGLYVFNPQATNPIIVTVPHPNDDFIGAVLGWKAFTTLNARYLFINGAGREVAFTGDFYSGNNVSLSDPTRNANHPFNLTYKAAANDIRALLTQQNSTLGREFSLQVHSYDSNGSPGFASCQISAGNGQNCSNLPTRDLSLTQTDMINAAGFIIHPPGTVDNTVPVYTTNFWTVYNGYYNVSYNDGANYANISNYVNLPGYNQSQQMLYTLSGWSKFDVYDPFFHIEMDELPNCYAQDDSTMNWFYGYDYETHSWNPVTRYQRVLTYYTPWVDALADVLPTVFNMNDGTAPAVPQIVSATVTSANYAEIHVNRLYEYDFKYWEASAVKMRYLGGGSYVTLDTLYFSNLYNYWSDQANTSFQIGGLLPGYTYSIRMGARDKSQRFSGWSNPVSVTLYETNLSVSGLAFVPSQSDEDHITIQWTAIGDTIPFNGFWVCRREAGTSAWDLIGTLSPTAHQYTDADFSGASTVYEYCVVTLGSSGQHYYSGVCQGWLRYYPAPEINALNWITPTQFHIAWAPVTQTPDEIPDSPDYYRLSVANNPAMLNAIDYIVIPAVGEPGYDLIFQPPAIIPARLFIRVTALANEVLP